MMFSITIATDNDAFQPDWTAEVRRILAGLVDALNTDTPESGPLFDGHDNACGSYEYSGPDSITISWHIDDVKEVRPDLTDAQCREVLNQAARKHDATIGITYDVLEIIADLLFPAKEG